MHGKSSSSACQPFSLSGSTLLVRSSIAAARYRGVLAKVEIQRQQLVVQGQQLAKLKRDVELEGFRWDDVGRELCDLVYDLLDLLQTKRKTRGKPRGSCDLNRLKERIKLEQQYLKEKAKTPSATDREIARRLYSSDIGQSGDANYALIRKINKEREAILSALFPTAIRPTGKQKDRSPTRNQNSLNPKRKQKPARPTSVPWEREAILSTLLPKSKARSKR